MSAFTAEELMKQYGLSDHVENGAFLECHYESSEEGRPSSGSIYYYVSPDEYTKFHYIDCDEYWCYIKGSPLELWMIDEDGKVSREKLGIEAGCKPLLYFKKGVKFASRHFRKEEEGTFLSCITVPRFSDKGFTLCEDGEILRDYPETEEFFKKAGAEE